MMRPLKVFVCKYASICNWNCEKCMYLLKELKIIELNEKEDKASPFPT